MVVPLSSNLLVAIAIHEPIPVSMRLAEDLKVIVPIGGSSYGRPAASRFRQKQHRTHVAILRTMSRQNIEIVRASVDAWNAGDMSAVRAQLAPDVILRMPEDWPEPGPFVGQDAVMRYGDQLRETWDADSAEAITEFVDIADHVVARFIWRTSGRGPEANIEFTIVYTVRKGSISMMEYFLEHAQALEALDLGEPGAQPSA